MTGITITKTHERAVVPRYQTPGSAGFDLHAVEDLELPPGATALVRTGLRMVIPAGFELQIRPRSGLSFKTKLRVANSPGTIDSDYRDEVKVIVENIAQSTSAPNEYQAKTIRIKAGERIAQGVLAAVPQAEFKVVSEDEFDQAFDNTERKGGFGSTGAA